MAFIASIGNRWVNRGAYEKREVTSMGDQVAWFVVIAFVAYLVPYVLTSVLDVQHDLYYLLYFAVALGAVYAYVTATGFDVRSFLLQNWKLSLVVGAASTAFVVWNVLARNDSTPHPDGAYFGFEILWRGAAYGLVDAVLLNVFPAMIAYSLLRGNVASLTRRVGFAVLALLLTVVITATYHLGYDQFRGSEVSKPEFGNVVIELPTLVSVNPLGSVVAHTSMHLAAVTHAYETDTFLPPQTFVEE